MDKFNGKVISKSPNQFDTIEWPARSCDLTPLDFWLWSYLKDKINTTEKPQTLNQLEKAITNQINLIRFDEKDYGLISHCTWVGVFEYPKN